VNTNNHIFNTRLGALGVIGLSALVAVFYGCSSSSGSPATPGDGGGEDNSVPEVDGAPPGDTGTPPTPDTGTTPPPDTGTPPPPADTGPPDAGPTVVNQKVTETKLFADTSDAGAAHVDTNLVNPWASRSTPAVRPGSPTTMGGSRRSTRPTAPCPC
jgi:hypothetical protein